MSSQVKNKLQKNKERRQREDLLRELPGGVSKIIENADFQYSNDYFNNLPISPWPNFVDGKIQCASKFSTYIYSDYDDIVHVHQFLKESFITFMAPVFCWFGKGPVFSLDHQIDISVINEIENLSAFSIFLAEAELKRGFILDNYCGHLPNNRSTNSNEMVFEIVYFSK